MGERRGGLTPRRSPNHTAAALLTVIADPLIV